MGVHHGAVAVAVWMFLVRCDYKSITSCLVNLLMVALPRAHSSTAARQQHPISPGQTKRGVRLDTFTTSSARKLWRSREERDPSLIRSVFILEHSQCAMRGPNQFRPW